MAESERSTEFSRLVELDPRLGELEGRVRAIEDDGSASFFCSNYVWLPFQGELKQLVGVDRRGAPDEEAEGALWDSHAFEAAYRHLSAFLPKCRNCGCRTFEPWRVATEGAASAERGR